MRIRIFVFFVLGVLLSIHVVGLLPAQSDKVAQLNQEVRNGAGDIRIMADAATEITSFLKSGVEKGGVSDSVLREGARSLGRALAENATFSEAEGRKVIDGSSFAAAKRGICPLYPFC